MTDSTLPTKKQRELLQFIDGFIKGNGYGPSYREIMRALGYKSVSTVATHVDGLVVRGWLIKRDNAARTLEVVSPSARIVKQSTEKQDRPTVDIESTLRSKLAELERSDEPSADDIAAIERTMRLLGFDDVPGAV